MLSFHILLVSISAYLLSFFFNFFSFFLFLFSFFIFFCAYDYPITTDWKMLENAPIRAARVTMILLFSNQMRS
jgi:hypothetical protein